MLDRADPRPAAAINLGLHHPAANCFPTETELLRHRLCGRRLRRIVLLMFLHQPDRPSPQLGVDLLRHIAILPNSERNGMEPVTIHRASPPRAGSIRLSLPGDVADPSTTPRQTEHPRVHQVSWD